MDFSNTRYYEILGVAQNASFENIEKAYRRELQERAIGQSEVFEAYNVLSDRQKRAEYDSYLEREGVFVTTAASASDYIQEQNNQNRESVDNQAAQSSSAEEVQEPEAQEVQEPEAQEVQEPEVQEVQEPKDDLDSKQDVITSPETPAQYLVNEKYNSFAESKKVAAEMKTKDLKMAKIINRIRNALIVSGFFATGGISFMIWTAIKDKKKLSLKKDFKAMKIDRMTTEEQQVYQAYLDNLSIQINKLLSEPRNDYKLQICRIKYENFIEFLQKKLDIAFAKRPTSGIDKFKNKVEIASLVKNLETAKKKLADVNEAIEKYAKTGISSDKKIDQLHHLKDNFGMSKIYERILSDEEKIRKLHEQAETVRGSISERKIESKITKLQIHQEKLLNKRNEKGTKMKYKAIKGANRFVLAKGFSKRQILKGFASEESFSDAYEESLQRTRH